MVGKYELIMGHAKRKAQTIHAYPLSKATERMGGKNDEFNDPNHASSQQTTPSKHCSLCQAFNANNFIQKMYRNSSVHTNTTLQNKITFFLLQNKITFFYYKKHV